MKKKLKSISFLKRKADKLFSLYIRRRDGLYCYTCNKSLTWQNSDCGHYVSRNWLALRYDQINCHCQCKGCNIFKKGNLTVYAVNLENQYGQTVLHDLERDKRKNMGDTREFLMKIIKNYA